MSKFETAEVPFQDYNGRQCLTGLQLLQEPWLMDLVKRFPDCFAPGPINRDIMFFYPDGDAPK